MRHIHYFNVAYCIITQFHGVHTKCTLWRYLHCLVLCTIVHTYYEYELGITNLRISNSYFVEREQANLIRLVSTRSRLRFSPMADFILNGRSISSIKPLIKKKKKIRFQIPVRKTYTSVSKIGTCPRFYTVRLSSTFHLSIRGKSSNSLSNSSASF